MLGLTGAQVLSLLELTDGNNSELEDLDFDDESLIPEVGEQQQDADN